MLTQDQRVYTIPGRPVAMARPRFSRNNNVIRVYNPQRVTKMQANLNLKAQHHGLPLIDYPVHIDILFTFKMPVSFNSHKRLLCKDKPYTGHIDLDNLLKFFLDCATGVIYNDDALVASISAKKVYGDENMTVFSFTKI